MEQKVYRNVYRDLDLDTRNWMFNTYKQNEHLWTFNHYDSSMVSCQKGSTPHAHTHGR